MGELFKGLSSEEREKYDEMNRKDKERYKKDSAAYEAKGKPKEDDSDNDKGKKDDSSDSDDSDDDSDNSD